MLRVVLFSFIIFNFVQPLHTSELHSDFNRSKVEDMHVYIRDDAKGACWTNLKESREYAEEKLRYKGIKLKDAWPAEYMFDIYVLAFRDNSGWCVGYVNVSITTGGVGDEIWSELVIGETAWVTQQKSNLNREVIDAISEMMNRF